MYFERKHDIPIECLEFSITMKTTIP